jgi:two-component system OmpR family response regulator
MPELLLSARIQAPFRTHVHNPGMSATRIETQPRVLVVEDDADLRRLLRDGLGEEGFSVEVAASGGEALKLADGSTPDALVVDIGLPDADGRDVCQALRARGVDAPVLFLTALDAVSDRVSGFSAGGDDYLTKPFALAELTARLRALLKRAVRDSAATAGDIRLDPTTHTVTVREAEAPLTPTEFRLLGALVGRRGEAVRRIELVRAGWADGSIVHDNTLDVYIRRLRRKLSELGAETEIATVHRVGYRLQ